MRAAFWSLGVALLIASHARASCVAVDPEELLLEPSSCRVVHPGVEAAVQRFLSLSPAGLDREAILRGYRGLLLNATRAGGAEDEVFFFPSRPGLACASLRTPVRVLVERACCDGDPNAPCLLGTSLRAELEPGRPLDPSAIPALRADGSRDQRYRVRVDLNGDGVQDLLLSHGLSLFGRAGGLFEVFLTDSTGPAERVGTMHLHPRLIALESPSGATRVWTYARSNAQSGTIGYYEIRDGRVSEFQGLRVNPGDGGTTLGNGLVETVFSAQHKVLPEKSQGDGDEVVWEPVQ